MGNVFSALESLEAKNDENNSDYSFESIISAVEDMNLAYEEVNDALNEYDDMDDIGAELTSSVEEIESLIEVISTHGICKSTVLAADPTGEFRNRNILPAIEELNDVPTND
jgi:hypothetical protein